MVTSHYTVPDYLALAMEISGKILGSVDTIIYGGTLHWYSCTHGLNLKLKLGRDGFFRCECYFMMHTDIYRGYITEDSAALVELRVYF